MFLYTIKKLPQPASLFYTALSSRLCGAKSNEPEDCRKPVCVSLFVIDTGSTVLYSFQGHRRRFDEALRHTKSIQAPQRQGVLNCLHAPPLHKIISSSYSRSRAVCCPCLRSTGTSCFFISRNEAYRQRDGEREGCLLPLSPLDRNFLFFHFEK